MAPHLSLRSITFKMANFESLKTLSDSKKGRTKFYKIGTLNYFNALNNQKKCKMRIYWGNVYIHIYRCLTYDGNWSSEYAPHCKVEIIPIKLLPGVQEQKGEVVI